MEWFSEKHQLVIDATNVYFMYRLLQVKGVLFITYICIIRYIIYAKCISPCRPDEINNTVSPQFLPVCIIYSQNMLAHYRKATQVGCKVKVSKRSKAPMCQIPPYSPSWEYFRARIRRWDGIVKWGQRCHWVGGWDKIQDDSTQPGPAAQGLTVEYTWPGSFRPYRDNWERLSVQLQTKLTQGIVCGGRSTRSGCDSINVWLHRNAKVSGLHICNGAGCRCLLFLLTTVYFQCVC